MKNITVNIAEQTLSLYENETLVKTYSVSTGLNGVGELENTGCTPRGKHTIAEKFGCGAPVNSVFVARQATGEIYNEALAQEFPKRDWILSRIMWLQGCEQGFNLGETTDGVVCDTKKRYIYIHGTPDTEPMGVAISHGCVRMRNTDIVELYDLVDVNTSVQICE